MIRLKTLELHNYCGIRDATFNFDRKDSKMNISVLYGPNGCGKSTVLYAIQQLGNPEQVRGRSCDLLFRKLTFHPDYHIVNDSVRYMSKIDDYQRDMYANALFYTDNGEKIVQIANNDQTSGIVKNDFHGESKYFIMNIDADNPMNTQRFQFNPKYKDIFLDIANAVYGYPCEFPSGNFCEVEEYDAQTQEYVTFYTDFVIQKPESRVHFKRMSAGERKIATMLAELCNPLCYDRYDIFLIDNIEMHIYIDRHERLIDKLAEHFPNKQIICTTHSGVLIDYVGYNYGIHHLYGVHKENLGQNLSEKDKEKIRNKTFNFWR